MSDLHSLINNHEFESAFQILSQESSESSKTEEEKAISVLLESAKDYEKDNSDLALKYYGLLVEYFPDRIVGYMRYGNILIATNRLAEAEDFFRSAIKRFPNAPGPYVRYAFIAEKKKDNSEARKRYQETLKIFPDHSIARQGLERVSATNNNGNHDNNNTQKYLVKSWKIQSIPTNFLPKNTLVWSVESLLNNTVFVSTKNNAIYRSISCGDDFELLTQISSDFEELDTDIGRLHSDGNAIYYSSRSTNKLYRYTEKTRKFEVVINDLGGTTRGFTQANNGYRFIGRYSQNGPAILFGSSDGIQWEVVHQWDAKHIHDVRINPANEWLYVVVGEGDRGKSKDSHSIFRSKDNGKSFSRIFSAQKTRPLFTAINFYDNKVLLGTDHFDSRNKIVCFDDDGEDKIYDVETIFTFPEIYPYLKPVPFVHYMEWFNDSLFVGFRGKWFCALIESTNLKDWKLIYCTTTEKSNCFVNACTTKNYFFTSGELMRIRADDIEGESNHQPGMMLPNVKNEYRFISDIKDSWSLGIEDEIKSVLLEVDPRYEKDICQGFFYRSNPFFFEKIHLRETLMFLLQKEVKKDSRILDFGTGTAQFLLFLAKFGFNNLHGWDHNQRWLTAAEKLFLELDNPDSVTLQRIEKPAIYDIVSQSGSKFDVITMFGLIYGHGIDIPNTMVSVYNALNPGGFFIANNSKHTKDEMKNWIVKAGLSLISTISKSDATDNEINKIYFCQKPDTVV
ncbi:MULTISPECIES: methyltransferase domain-containing protein [unclassified Okeania]|uniref:methyltransferase domain-containing protein n=1 Tax=unclassified Okeania TaxID=2634635 RepID=UPI0013B5FBC7|nr:MULTISPECIES: methyltransferase domain-containing protein [unclassified Okeania]NES77033.1 methyltransferase domain-containing protein [Okeania sp. SIO1H4]NET18528.1 methyltransferase domain-containing protein [Okeania sp. SIO1H5]NET94871.1 methyltransferase domain-containing protein [Okeania sp. SIO1H2]